MTLEDMWTLLKARISPRSEIQFWSATKGYLGERFAVMTVDSGSISVVATGAERTEKIADRDFVAVLRVWNDYVDKKIEQSEIEAITRHADYVVGILHSLEQSGPADARA
jgi:hypothetical protein